MLTTVELAPLFVKAGATADDESGEWHYEFCGLLQRKFCEVNGLHLPPPPKENTQ